jgi:ferredoxin-nitrite reductase
MEYFCSRRRETSAACFRNAEVLRHLLHQTTTKAMNKTNTEQNENSPDQGFSGEQKNYLQGFALGSDVARAVRGLPILSGSAAAGSGADGGSTVQIGPQGATAFHGPDQIHFEAFAKTESAGGKLCSEEKSKREKNSLEMWGEIDRRCQESEFPTGADVFLTKAHGLFYVAPAQDAYMCRMRVPGGHLNSSQLIGISELADDFAGGYADVTTRANFQLREILARHGMDVLVGLRNLGIVNQGAGADNVRNVTAGATSGFDPEEIIETLPLAQHLHWYLLNHRELFGLPRKFNISFDGAGTISPLSDTNDVGFFAVEIPADLATVEMPAGIWFQLRLGGITGHKDLARPTSVLVRPEQCSQLCGAILRVFVKNGNRTDRKKARLKYLLDDWGFDRFLEAVETEFGSKLERMENEKLTFKDAENRFAHVGFHRQQQAGKNYLGIVLPVGRLTSDQLRAIAEIADRFGDRYVRLTVWQNLLIPGIDDADIPQVKRLIESMGLDWNATSARAGLVACTGNQGCKFAAADTKRHAMELAQYLDDKIDLDQPLNIHVTGCHNSCAQHYIGDIGLQGTAVSKEDDIVEGYHIVIGGGYGVRGRVGRQLFDAVAFEEIPPLVESILLAYLEHRADEREPFVDFAARSSDEQLIGWGGREEA